VREWSDATRQHRQLRSQARRAIREEGRSAKGQAAEDPEAEVTAEFPLAYAPGFHGLERTALVGLAGPGSAILDVYCTCNARDDEPAPVTRITVRLSKAAPEEFVFAERGRGRIEITPGLNLLTDHGHFATNNPWITSPDGWTQIGKVTQGRLALRGKKNAPPPAPPKLAIAVDALCGSDECGGRAGHTVDKHDPCSACANEKKAKKICRSFVPLKKKARR
jgi:hypothetical protein